MKITGAEAVIESLRKEQVQVVFGYPGGAVLSLYDALYRMKFPHILTGHEQAPSMQRTAMPGPRDRWASVLPPAAPGSEHGHWHCHRQHGFHSPGGDQRPGGHPSDRPGSFQEADISGITTPITKHNYLVKRVQDLPRVLKEAFYIARSGRPGPVLVDVAKDMFDTPFDYEYPETVSLRGYQPSRKAGKRKCPPPWRPSARPAVPC